VTLPDAATTPDALPVLEALRSTPARRYLSDRPIPESVIWAILDAAVRGPSGGNRQGWGWVVLTDPAVKAQIGQWYREGWEKAYGFRRAELQDAAGGEVGLSGASFRAGDHLAAHIHEAPVWIFPVLRQAAGSDNPRLGASIYGAVQQLLLAARAYGIGTTLTTLYVEHEREVADLLGLPDDALTMALIPLGYPARGRWALPTRKPLAEVVHWDQWGSLRAGPPVP